MKKRNSLKCIKARHPDNQVIIRGKRVYVINKANRRYNVRQG